MKLTAKLAYSQIKSSRGRTAWTLAGIILATAMITAVFGFAASGDAMFRHVIGDNEYYINMYNSMLFGMSAVFVSIIVAASVIVVSNAFRVSAGERAAQFGILKSVGATKKQIAETIMYEGVYLCLIGIPAGLALGLLVNLTGVRIVDYFLTRLNNVSEQPLVLDFVIAWQALLLSVIISFMTVGLSAWLPARKAAGLTAIDAIRVAGEVKVKPGQARKNWLIQKLFGFEGVLASKSLKRSRRNFRATVVSLTVSIVLFIVVGTFGMMMGTLTNVFFPGIDINVAAQFYSYYDARRIEDWELIERKYVAVNSVLAGEITEKMREFPDTDVFGAGADYHSYRALVPIEMLNSRTREILDPPLGPDNREHIIFASLIVLDAENYDALCRLAGVPRGSNILVNQFTLYHDEGRQILAPLIFSNQTLRMKNYYYGDEFDITLHGVLSIGEIPKEILWVSNSMVNIIVPALDALSYVWFANSSDAAGFTEYAGAVLRDMFTFDESLGDLSVFNIQEQMDMTRDIGRLIMVFIYGFIAMLTLIGLTNVISTISANVRSRSREFAVLRSAGMTPEGLSRMLNLESILCSLKSLVIGLPLGVAGSYAVYRYLAVPVELGFPMPWLPIIQYSLGVLIVTWVTMRYSASRIQGKNIIETIRY
ncbi:MAG: FtsX-like permease family protein [Defluviitaleaceae bacterium]|nr:FtsX-like permease family protein [Defluviitaleaceae bacterium]